MAGRNGKRPAKRGGRKKSGEKSGGELIRQPHGGAIRNGSAPGNTPGTGRPPSAIKATARDLFDERLPKLAGIADTAKRDGDRIRAMEVLGKVGLDANVSVADVRAALVATEADIRAELSEDVAERLLARIGAHWLKL